MLNVNFTGWKDVLAAKNLSHIRTEHILIEESYKQIRVQFEFQNVP